MSNYKNLVAMANEALEKRRDMEDLAGQKDGNGNGYDTRDLALIEQVAATWALVAAVSEVAALLNGISWSAKIIAESKS